MLYYCYFLVNNAFLKLIFRGVAHIDIHGLPPWDVSYTDNLILLLFLHQSQHLVIVL